MKATKFIPKTKRHPALKVWQEDSLTRLVNEGNCIFVDGSDDFWKNDGDTIVFALPKLQEASHPDNAHIYDWVDEYIDVFLLSVAELKPDEFDIEPLEGMNGYSRIVRMWFD